MPMCCSLPWTRCHPADSVLTSVAPVGWCGDCQWAHPWLRMSQRTRPWKSRWTALSLWHRFPEDGSRASGPRSRPPITGDVANTHRCERQCLDVSRAHSRLKQTKRVISDTQWYYLLPLLLLLLLLHALLYLAQEAGRVWGEALEAVLLCQLLQPGSQLPVGHLNLLEL